MGLSELQSALTHLHCASPTIELTSEDETNVVQSAGVCVRMHGHTYASLFPPFSEAGKENDFLS